MLVNVGVAVGVEVAVDVGVNDGVGVSVGVSVGVAVGVAVMVDVATTVDVKGTLVAVTVGSAGVLHPLRMTTHTAMMKNRFTVPL